MKIRTGFVSNSSSSSFCLIGLPILPEGEISKILNEEATKVYEEDPYCGLDLKYNIIWEVSDENDGGIGIYFDMKEDQTWKEAKHEAWEKLQTILLPGVGNEDEIDLIYGSKYS